MLTDKHRKSLFNGRKTSHSSSWKMFCAWFTVLTTAFWSPSWAELPMLPSKPLGVLSWMLRRTHLLTLRVCFQLLTRVFFRQLRRDTWTTLLPKRITIDCLPISSMRSPWHHVKSVSIHLTWCSSTMRREWSSSCLTLRCSRWFTTTSPSTSFWSTGKWPKVST